MPVTYHFIPDVDFDESRAIIREAAALLPDGVEILDREGWDGFLEHYLGEGQFGPDRYNLSSSKRLYYQLKPLLPRSAVRLVRKGYRQFQENGFPLNWPIEERFVKFLNTLKTNAKLSINNNQLSMAGADSERSNSAVKLKEKSKLSINNDQLSMVSSDSGQNCSLPVANFALPIEHDDSAVKLKEKSKLSINNNQLSMATSDVCHLTSDLCVVDSSLFTPHSSLLQSDLRPLTSDLWNFWPFGKRFAFVITHDVETERGLQCVEQLAKIDADHGFRSSFNFVPERYSVDAKLREELIGQGFEVGVHGLKHDGKLFFSKKMFDSRAARINHYLREWKAVGFRSPLTHRNPEWMQSLEIEYDSSFFDSDPYETMPGGTMTIWPFLMGHFVELPYTLPQDSTLFLTLGETSIETWKRKTDWIAENGGMVLVNVHPDYIDFENKEGKGLFRSGKYPLGFYVELLQYIKDKGNYWNALPRDVAKWCRESYKR